MEVHIADCGAFSPTFSGVLMWLCESISQIHQTQRTSLQESPIITIYLRTSVILVSCVVNSLLPIFILSTFT